MKGLDCKEAPWSKSFDHVYTEPEVINQSGTDIFPEQRNRILLVSGSDAEKAGIMRNYYLDVLSRANHNVSFSLVRWPFKLKIIS